ncbi:unnamed protein product [Lasius platythorax]|uniref:Bee-milk protein n=1 Tax=Lasius platythorax TaxID=488582 RepID=A0AAV2NI69_9HYME
MSYLLFITSILSITIMTYGLHFDRNKVKIEFPYEWKYVDFVWDCEQQKHKAIDSGDYNASACLLHDVDKAPDGRVFVAGYKTKGSPVGVMTVSNEEGDGGPLLRPYPNWDWWSDCESNKCITGFYRLRIKCNHLFVVHSGKFRDRDKVCPARLLIFDLSTDKLIKKITIPFDIANNKNGSGLLMTSYVYTDNCNDIANTAIIYITDTEGYGLIIYDARNSTFCRIESDFMKPKDTIFITKDKTFNLTEGIFSLAIINKDLYFADASGINIYKVKKSKLQCPLSIDEANQAIKVAATLSGQINAVAAKDCAIFFVNVPEGSILCADSSKEINSENTVILAQNTKKLILQSALKVQGDELIGMTNNYHHFLMGTSSIKEINFRIFVMNIMEIQSRTKCFASCK